MSDKTARAVEQKFLEVEEHAIEGLDIMMLMPLADLCVAVSLLPIHITDVVLVTAIRRLQDAEKARH